MKRVALAWIDSRYEVDRDGVVWSYANSHGGRSKRAKRLKPQVSSSGYLQVRLPHDGVFKWVSVHRIVLRAFTKLDKPQVNHLDGNRFNNHLQNLEWSTASENMRHSYRVLGRKHPKPALGKTGAANPGSKKVVQITLQGEEVKIWDSAGEAQRAGFSQGNISSVCLGIRRTHAGFVWRFV